MIFQIYLILESYPFSDGFGFQHIVVCSPMVLPQEDSGMVFKELRVFEVPLR